MPEPAPRSATIFDIAAHVKVDDIRLQILQFESHIHDPVLVVPIDLERHRMLVRHVA